jgi:hypothetical protein
MKAQLCKTALKSAVFLFVCIKKRLLMFEQELFIKKVKSFLPYDCRIDIKKDKNCLISVRKKIFLTHININPIFLKSDHIIFNDIIYFLKYSTQKNNELKEVKKRLSLFYENNNIKKNITINTKFKDKNISLMYENIISNFKNIYNTIDFSVLKITWGRNSKNRTRSIRFGSFDKKKNLIRIHPILDNKFIPDHFLKSVIYHEISHFVCDKLYPELKTYHNKIFYQILEKLDQDYFKSMKWEKDNKKIFFR